MNEREQSESDGTEPPTDDGTSEATEETTLALQSVFDDGDGTEDDDRNTGSERREPDDGSDRSERADGPRGPERASPASTDLESEGVADVDRRDLGSEVGSGDEIETSAAAETGTDAASATDSDRDRPDVSVETDGATESTEADGTAEPTEADGTAEPTEADSAAAESAASSAAEGADSSAEQRTVDLSDPTYYLNRELSELAFQRRVLHEVLDADNPLLERVKFLAIVTTNLDEFFRKRIGGLKQQIAAGITDETPDGRTPREQWNAALAEAEPLLERQARCYREEILPALADEGIDVVEYDALSDDERRQLREYFESAVLPTLTPLTFDPAHSFPFISNQSLSLAVLTRERPDAELTFSRVKIPRNQLRFIQLGDEPRYVLLEDAVRANLELLFPDVDIVDTALFRVTRNAEVRRDEEVAEDLIEMIEEVIEERRFATVVRLEIERDTSDRILDVLTRELDLDDREVFHLGGPLDYRDFAELTALDRPELKLPEWSPQPHPRLDRLDEGETVFDVIRTDDVLVHHPYHSFEGTVQRFLETAANDPDVLAIKAAIYRTASDSQIVESLLEAARNGKQVAVMVELKARFDEENNLEWAKKLEEEGIHVAYGTIGYKTHTKTSLVVRDEDEGVRLYSHVGTGNYHSETAKRYEDLGLLTADRDIGQDLVKLFNYFTGHSMHREYRKLLIAPGNMRDRFVDLVRAEAERARNGEMARIVAKMNRLEDPELVRELYEASMAGVDIDLIVRDICRLRPGLEGISETIDVYSVVGRFLEHSRIFYFRAGGDGRYYIGSADWMTRNLDNRVEAVTPIEDPRLQRRLDGLFETLLSDDRNRWVMRSDGTYERCEPTNDGSTTDVHETFMRSALDGARR
ncbi:polyphosphate kinase 1 [Natrinema salaciae]|uniref:Polyphosphate kinase n=1 Tax=Natrinema salaciae TaxID=1186196 RepID=A0A1H9A4T6_9EURY|nr:polyphosphate kinase 1 [Natrinema salaciae]SEP70998.1 polyphosphate kinase [Natrinema salaciae]